MGIGNFGKREEPTPIGKLAGLTPGLRTGYLEHHKTLVKAEYSLRNVLVENKPLIIADPKSLGGMEKEDLAEVRANIRRIVKGRSNTYLVGTVSGYSTVLGAMLTRASDLPIVNTLAYALILTGVGLGGGYATRRLLKNKGIRRQLNRIDRMPVAEREKMFTDVVERLNRSIKNRNALIGKLQHAATIRKNNMEEKWKINAYDVRARESERKRAKIEKAIRKKF